MGWFVGQRYPTFNGLVKRNEISPGGADRPSLGKLFSLFTLLKISPSLCRRFKCQRPLGGVPFSPVYVFVCVYRFRQFVNVLTDLEKGKIINDCLYVCKQSLNS